MFFLPVRLRLVWPGDGAGFLGLDLLWVVSCLGAGSGALVLLTQEPALQPDILPSQNGAARDGLESSHSI